MQAVPGVAEVASIGGFVRQYQVTVDPVRLAAYKIPLETVVAAVRDSNNEVGGRLLEFAGAEYMVRGRGYSRTVEDFGSIVVKATAGGVPVLLRDVARVEIGPELRRGVSDLDGTGDTVGGIVVMRHGENALNVIRRVKARLEELKPSLPRGVEIVTTYDRSDLITRAIDTLKHELTVEMVIVSFVILVFLWHIPSAVVPIVTIPVSVLLAFIPMYYFGLTVNIMSLAGIAISIGVLVDGAIVEVENAYNKLYHWQAGGRKGDFHAVRLAALTEVGPSVFFSLLVIAVAFLPVFALVDQEGRLFKPLAFSKNLAMAIAAVLAVTIDPALRMLFARMDPFTFKPRWLAWVATEVARGDLLPGGAPPDQPRHPPGLRAGLPLRAAPPLDGDRRLGRAGRGQHPGLLQARPRVHAAAARGVAAVHADDAARPRRLRGAADPRDAGPDPQDHPRGRAGLREGRARRHLDRPGAVLDDGDDHHPQARGAVAGEGALVLLLGAGVVQGLSAQRLARPPLLRGAAGRDGRQARRSPG